MSDDIEEPEEAAPGGPSLFERFVPPVDVVGDDGEPKPSRMTSREQMVTVGLGFANIAIAAGAASGMASNQGGALLLGLAASAVTIVGARVGNRLLAMAGLFLSVVTRDPDSTVIFLVFGAPYYAAAVWMFMKYNKLVKAQTLLRRQQRSESRTSGGSGPATRSSRGKATEAKEAGRSRPTASKRYTPPKPPKKRPPPPPKPPRDRSIVD